MIFLGSVVLLVQLLEPFVASDFTAVVQTSSGPVQGVILRTVHSTEYAAFKGIKYAEPPIGNLRFKPPVPVKPWTETRHATADGDKCPQYGSDGSVVGSEDCLFLNVLTPVTRLNEPPTELKAVMVWIHEGTFADGSSSTYIKQPDYLLERDVVFVSMNYRLGALGFLALFHPDATGNQGLKDQNLALKWVNENIEKFGGDPRKVTIFGKGAGAASVGFHVLSEASRGLFHRAISMSGTPLAPHSFSTQRKAAIRGWELANLVQKGKLKVPHIKEESILEVLSEASFERLLRKTQRMDKIAPFVPTVEPAEASNGFLYESPEYTYLHGTFNRVPQILGSTQLDTMLYTNYIKKAFKHIDGPLDMINSKLGKERPLSPYFKKAEKMGLRMKPLGLSSHDKYWQIPRGIMIYDPVSKTVKYLSNKNDTNPVYQYRMVLPSHSHLELYRADEDINLNAAEYADDLAYIFHHSFKNENSSDSSSNDLMIDRVSTWWTNFAKYGNPTPDEINQGAVQLAWPASEPLRLAPLEPIMMSRPLMTRRAQKFLQIDNELTIKNWQPMTLVTTKSDRYSTLFSIFFES